MNKSEIKQIILEEIEAALQEMNENMSPEDMAADSRPEEGDDIEGPGYEDMPGAKVTPFVTDLEARIARAMETGDEDELEDLAAGELDRAGLDEMARTANVFALAKEASIKDVLGFMQRVNNLLKTYKSPGQKRPKKRFTPEEMKALAKVMLQDGGFTSKDIIAATSYNSPAQANKFLAALEQKGLIKLTSQLKKSMAPERDPDAPETRGRKAKSAEFDVPDDALDMDFGDFEDLDLGDIGALEEAASENLELKSAAKKIFTQLKGEGLGQVELVNYELGSIGSFGRMGKKAGLIKTYDKPYAVISYSAKGVDIELAGPNEEIVKRYTQKLQSDFPEFKYSITGRPGVGWNKGGYTARILIRPGKTTSENKTTMSELEKYIKQQIKEAKQVRLQEAKAEKNLKDLIALGLMAANKEAVAESLQLNEVDTLTYSMAQKLLDRGDTVVRLAKDGSIDPNGGVFTNFKLSDIGPDQAVQLINNRPKLITPDGPDVSDLVQNLDAITSSPNSAADVAQKVIDSGIEGVSGGVGGGGSGGALGDFSGQAVDIFGNLTQGVGDLLGVSPGAAAVVLGSTAIAGPLVYMISKAAKGKDTVMPDFVDKFIARFADKIKGAAKGAGIGFKSPEKISDLNEAKNLLAKKMKEIENQGRLAALETKLAAVAEMIEETEGRLTRIDEDNEFRDMMDKNAVKEVRKQLKELERAQAKLQKEYDKAAGGRKKKEVMDEDLPVAEDAVDIAVDEIELEEDNFALNESTLRMQKLAGLITESDIQKKTSLNEETSNEELLKLLQSNPDKVYLNTGKWPRMNVKNFETSKAKDKGQVIDFDSRQGEFWFFWTGEKYKDAPKNINDGTKIIGGFKLDGTQIWFTVMGGRAEKYLVARLQRPEFTSKPGEIDYLKVAQFGN